MKLRYFSQCYIVLYNEDLDKATFNVNQRHVLAVVIDKINHVNDNNFYEDDPDTIIHIRLLASCNKFEKQRALKKTISGELMPVV